MRCLCPTRTRRFSARFLGTALLTGCCAIAVAVPAAAQRPSGDPAQPGWQRGGGSAEVTLRGRLETGVMAIGAETTGTTVDAGGITFELDLQNRPRLRRAAERMDGRRVIVEGELHRRRGVERGQRLIVQPRRIERLESPNRRRGNVRDWERLWDRYPGGGDWPNGRDDVRYRDRPRGSPGADRDRWDRDGDRGDRDRGDRDRGDRDRGDRDRGDRDRGDRDRGDRDRGDRDRGDRDRGDWDRDDRGDRDRRDGDRDRGDGGDRERRDQSIRIDIGRLLEEALGRVPQ